MMKRVLLALVPLLVPLAAACGSDGSDAPGDSQSSLVKSCVADCSAIAAPACEVSTCDTTTGQCVFAPLDGTPCDDGQFCTVDDTCHAGVCSGAANDCGLSAIACKTSTCNEATHSCQYEAQADGFLCDVKDVCAVGGSCQSGSCVPTAKTCHFEPAPDECHVATCNATTGACDVFVPANDGVACFFEPCVANGVCQNGNCVGDPRDCSGYADACNTSSCDAAHNGCFKVPAKAGVACDTDDQCNTGKCDATGACVLTAANEGKACKDALSCTTFDTCHSGLCTGTPPGTTKVYFEESFSNNRQGWTLDGSWGIGAAQNINSFPYSSCKPQDDASNSLDMGIATTNPGGHDGETVHDFMYLTSKAVDTSAATSLVLTFGTLVSMPLPPYGFAVAEVYDGAKWVQVWQDTSAPESCTLDPDTFLPLWTTVTVDVAAHKNAAMRVRFGTKFVLADPSAGLSIDDVALMSAACP